MKTIKEINLLRISEYINVCRDYFSKNNFFEQTLYSTVPYAVTNTDSFQLKNNLFLRHFPEPEIWIAQEKSDKFFWIGSLFRNEKEITKIHNYEFKIVDFYVKDASTKEIVNLFFELLCSIEKSLSLTGLSKLEITFITFEDFSAGKFVRTGKHWLVVTNYPKEESFYDAISEDQKTTSKFEIMFVNSGEVTEIAAAGVIGKNLNEVRTIIDANNSLGFSENVYAKNFIGLGFGVERLIYLYELK